MSPAPEALARQRIDAQLLAAGWAVQDRDAVNLHAARGVAVREFRLRPGHGAADYLLFVDRKALGVVEAKPAGATLTGVEPQSAKYSTGLPEQVPAPIRPLPFLYQSTGEETRFTSLLDPEPRSRAVFHFHRPETLAGWICAEPLWLPAGHRLAGKPASLRLRLRNLPELTPAGLWPAQVDAGRNLEKSLGQDRPRALIQMATGSGKTFTAVNSIYRLVKHAEARRVLFLVDRANLGKQALREFQTFSTPDDGRKFTELYNVQLLSSGRIDPVARVTIGTIQRLYSILQGKDLAEEEDERSAGGLEGLIREPVPVGYNPAVPVETFDVIFVDECHRSIYTLWRQVLEYFDAHLVGLTATPSKQTFGFFNRNLVMEYGHQQAVADDVNVDFDVYRIRTRITEQGSAVEAGLWVDRRERETRRKRWEQLDEELVYDAAALDRDVVAPDQIRTVIRAFRDRLFSEIFPGRTEVPKTLVFAKDDSHADDVVQIIREEFGKGNEFAQKITYRTTGDKPENLINNFRNSYNPRIAVTVDMIATGTDIKPLEIVLFLRQVRSRNLFEQMKGRGVRTISPGDLQSVTPDGGAKTRFVIVDAVGVCEGELSDTHPLERKPTVALDKLLQAVAYGNTDPEVVSTIAGRLARLDRQLGPEERGQVERAAGGRSLRGMVQALVSAVDPDRMAAAGQQADGLIAEAVRPLAESPELRGLLVDLRRSKDQTIDTVSQDQVLNTAFSADATARARTLVGSFETFIREHRDDIAALEVIYGRPRGRRLRYDEAKALAEAVEAPPLRWTTERLWEAYETLRGSRVRGAPERVLSNLVKVVRFAIEQEDELVPHPEVGRERFAGWLAQQEQRGRRFTAEQIRWLEAIRDQILVDLEIRPDDFDYAPFAQWGGLGAADRVFGGELSGILDELMGVLAA